jgi:hypothetical protein
MWLRLCTILHLYYCLEEKECQAAVCKAMLHCYPLLVTSQSGPEDEAPHQDFLDSTQTYFIKLFENSPSTFQLLCSSFITKQVTSLPNAALECISLHMIGRLQGGDSELIKFDAAKLDDLFQHFLLHKEDTDSTLPQVEEGRYCTLSELIDLVVLYCLAHYRTDLCWWNLSYSWLNLMEQQLTGLSGTRRNPTLTDHDDGEDCNNTTDKIRTHPNHDTNNSPINAKQLCKLIDRIKRNLNICQE